MEEKETIGDGGGRKYANSQFSIQNRQDAISRVSAVQDSSSGLTPGESTDGLAAETHGHINSAGCKGMATTVTAAHHSIWMHLYDSMHAVQKPKSKLNFVMLDKEGNMSTLWRRQEFLRICSKEDLADKAQDIEVTIPVKTSQETRYNFSTTAFFVIHFWSRPLDGVAINGALQIEYTLEFKRSTDRTRGSYRSKKQKQMSSAKASSVHSVQLLRSGNLSRLTLWWLTADWLLKANSTPSSKSLMYKKEKKTNSSPIM